MPYIKPKEPPFIRVRRLLLGYEMTPQSLAAVLECSENTARARLRSPETLTLGELDKISRRGHIPMEEIRAALVR